MPLVRLFVSVYTGKMTPAKILFLVALLALCGWALWLAATGQYTPRTPPE